MNKTVAEGKAILWTKSAASAPVINGGGDNYLMADKQTSYDIKFSINGNGTYNFYLGENSTPFVSNVSKLKLTWSGNTDQNSGSPDILIAGNDYQYKVRVTGDNGNYTIDDIANHYIPQNHGEKISIQVQSTAGVAFYLKAE